MMIKINAGFFDPARPGQLTLGLNLARPETARASFGPPEVGPARDWAGPFRIELGPSRIGPAREQH